MGSKKIIERYYQRLTLDFNTNKRICDEVALIPSKRLRNKIAGFTTHMMKRISRGPVKGISLKLQEEEPRSVSTTFRTSLLWISRSRRASRSTRTPRTCFVQWTWLAFLASMLFRTRTAGLMVTVPPVATVLVVKTKESKREHECSHTHLSRI